MKDEFRLAGTLKEFYGELENQKKAKSKILLWQTDANGKRSTCEAIMQGYLANKDQTTITLKPESGESFDQKLPFFIYEEKKGMLFKGRYENFVNGILRVLAENKVFLKEKRLVSRVNFHYTKVFVNIQYGKKIDLQHIKLKDISEFGFGLLCTESMAKALTLGVELGIKSINGIEMPDGLDGIITHKTSSNKVKGTKGGLKLVGVKFDKQSKLIGKVIKTLNESS
jgi:hypothetical protein